MRRDKRILKMILAALFLALAYVMPFLTGQIPEFGSMLCPMHIPVLLCGFICGWPWGLAVGITAPLFRSLILGMPPFFPTALCMAFELGAYGAVSGIIYKILPKKKLYIYCSLLTAMVLGRLVWGAAMFFCTGVSGGSFSLAAFISGALTKAIPGIIIQIVLIPVLIMILDRQNFSNKKDE
ncbi:MAG: ECF transporter S component [Ruminococcaceae bacterium]|nr:ECF transporter S component [Oscillospiraceae bacterium]